MEFSTSYDRATKIISTLVSAGLAAVVFAVHNLVLSCLSILVIALCYAFSPRGYVLEGRSVLVKRVASNVRIELDSVQDARRATADDLRGCIRLWGSGGLFGYYGLFSTAKLGKSTWYVTNRGNSVVVIMGSKTVLFSPDDPDRFLGAIRAAAPTLQPHLESAFDAERPYL